MLFLLSLFLILSLVLSMPYRAPLMGKEGGKRTLVIFDNVSESVNFSVFLNDLESRGHNLDLIDTSNKDVSLKKFGEYLYDNLILLSPISSSLPSKIEFDDITEFVNDGNNLLITLDKDASDINRDLSLNFGVELSPKGYEVIDHSNFYGPLDIENRHTSITVKNLDNTKYIFHDIPDSSSSIYFKGIAQVLDRSSYLNIPVISGNSETYSFTTTKHISETETPLLGQEAVLVTAVQGRNNARIVVSGSVLMFSNKFFRLPGSNNQKFSQSLTKWNFGERGIIRFSEVTHHKVDGTNPELILHEKERPDLPITLYPDPELTRNSLVYRIKDEIYYSIKLEEFVDDKWVPYTPDDLQLEFIMLDPYIRKDMKVDENEKKNYIVFQAPDSYGIFKFRVFYQRLGYSTIHSETQVSLRPFKHDEYERFIFSAYPYYSSVVSGIIALITFTYLFLFSKDK